MFKKILFIMLIISTVSFSISLEEYRSDNNVNTIEISQGWNLISFYDLWAIRSSTCDAEGIENTFFLPNGENQYVSLSKLSEGDNINTILSGYFSVGFNNQKIVSNNYQYLDKAFWYKSPNTVNCDNGIYSVLLENNHSLTYKDTLKQGWSMITIAPEMVGNKIGDVFGSCNIRKLLGYENNQWVTLEFDNDYTIKESDVSKPFFVGLRNDCDIDITGDDVVSYDVKEIGNEIGRDRYISDYTINIADTSRNIPIEYGIIVGSTSIELTFNDEKNVVEILENVIEYSESDKKSESVTLIAELKDIDDEYYYDINQNYPNTYIRLIDINEINGIPYAVVVSYT